MTETTRPEGESSDATRRLRTLWRELDDLRHAIAILEWDQETHMPPAGHAARASALGSLSVLHHRALVAPSLRDALETIASEAGDDPEIADQVRIARRAIDRSVRVPESLTRALAEAKSHALAVWQQARKDDDFAAFSPHLETLLSLKREEMQAVDADRPVYDSMLDDFEPDATEAQLVPLFDRLRRELSSLMAAVAERGAPVDESPLLGRYDGDVQLAFSRAMSEAFGFDYEAGRLDRSAHPFCTGIARRDVRLTGRHDDGDLRPCLYGILHETGHGLFEQGIPAHLAGTPMGDVRSLGVHESQSRLWENHVGRSRGFLAWAAPAMTRALPGFDADPEALWSALHTMKPSLIRVDADEATYNLHVIIRFDLERALVAGDLDVSDLPAAWGDAYQSLLGVRPPNDADGALQDVHWAHGIFGYFPTYTLGTMAAAQLYRAARGDLGDLEGDFAAGRFAPLLEWLRHKVHRHAGRYGVDQAMRAATGAPLDPEPLIDYLKTTTETVYGL